MIVARMWESRLLPERADAFFADLRSGGWHRITSARGFAGGEVYRSPYGGDEHRAVVVTRWRDAQAAADAAGLEAAWAAYCAREPHSWQFVQVDCSIS